MNGSCTVSLCLTTSWYIEGRHKTVCGSKEIDERTETVLNEKAHGRSIAIGLVERVTQVSVRMRRDRGENDEERHQTSV